MVGSGLYTDDIDQLVRKTLLSNLAIVLVVMLVVGGVGLLVTRSGSTIGSATCAARCGLLPWCEAS